MMLKKSLLLLAVLLVAANGSAIYASLFKGTGCQVYVSDLGSFKMTRDTCTQIPWPDTGLGVPIRPADGYTELYTGSYIYAKTTVSPDPNCEEAGIYSTIFSTESDCTASQAVNPNPVTGAIDDSAFNTASDADAYGCGDLSIGGVAYSLKISDVEGLSNAANYGLPELDCTSDTETLPNQGCVVVTPPPGTTFTCQAIKTAYKSQNCCTNSAGTFTVPPSNSRRLLSTASPGDPQVVDQVVKKFTNWDTLLTKGLISAQEYSTRRTRLLESLA